MKRKRSGGFVLVAVIVIGAAAAGWYFYHERAFRAGIPLRRGNYQAKQAEQSSDEAIPVETVRLSKGGIVKTSTQIGTVQPFKEADLYAKVSGYLKILNVDYGSKVKKDQLLAEIDDPEVVTAAEKAAADVEQAKAAVEQAQAFIESAKADRDAAASAVEQAVAEVDRYVSTTKATSREDPRPAQATRLQQCSPSRSRRRGRGELRVSRSRRGRF